MRIKPKGFRVGGKTTIGERSAYRCSENKLSPAEYNQRVPSAAKRKYLKDFIKQTYMSSTNVSFPVAYVKSFINVLKKALGDMRAKNHETIMHIARDDTQKKMVLGYYIGDVERFMAKVKVRVGGVTQ